MSKDKNREKVNPTIPKEIPLSLTKSNLIKLLTGIINGNSEYTQFDLSNWCYKYFGGMYFNNIEPEDIGLDRATYDVIRDIDMEWDLYLVNEFKSEELNKINLADVKLPLEWYKDWLSQLS